MSIVRMSQHLLLEMFFASLGPGFAQMQDLHCKCGESVGVVVDQLLLRAPHREKQVASIEGWMLE